MSSKEDIDFSDLNVPESLKKEVEGTEQEELLVEYMTQGGGDQKEKIRSVDKWFPGEHEWKGKTDIQPHQARPLAIVRHLATFFDEIEPVAPLLMGMADDYEKYLTSVDGEARSEQVNVLRAMFGADTAEEQSERAMRNFLTAKASEDEND